MSDPQFLSVIEDYQRYKYNFARNIMFDGDRKIKGETRKLYNFNFPLFREEQNIPPSPAVKIYLVNRLT